MVYRELVLIFVGEIKKALAVASVFILFSRKISNLKIEIMKIEIKIVPWIYSDEWFNIKVRKERAWFWATVREASEDILDNNWYFTKIIMRANEQNKEKALSIFSSWEDYLKYKTAEIEKIRVRQKEVDNKRKLKKEELNKLYK